MIMLKRLIAKITSLYGDKLQRVMLDNDEPNRLAGKRPAKQMPGVIVCLPKSSDPTTPANFRYVTLLNAGYKIIIAY